MFLWVIELSAFIVVLWLLLFQIFFPAIKGQKPFLIFRKQAKLIGELQEASQKVHNKAIEKKIIDQKVQEKHLDDAIKTLKEKERI